ncbi:MAG TPA: cytochrome-c peroxidase, partial [Rhodanobacter sp.]
MTGFPLLPFVVRMSRQAAFRSRVQRLKIASGFVACCLLAFGANSRAATPMSSATAAPDGRNPHPVPLNLPPAQPLSAAAQLGKLLFFDTSLSASGRQSCASCHSPTYAYNPPNHLTIQPGGKALKSFGDRPPPSLAYLYRQQPFSIGPDTGPDDVPVNLN